MSESAPNAFDVIEYIEGGLELWLGVITLDRDGLMTVVAPAAHQADHLRMILHELNREIVLHESVPPPAGARPFAMFSRPVPRGTPHFTELLLDYLDRYYAIELRAR